MKNKILPRCLSASRKSEAGFTLVELAIVMIIIGLLIGGVLKGQQLISNAQVASTVAQIKGIDAAVNTFRDSYQGFPGDFRRATARIANCTGCVNGNGNGRIADAVNIGTPTVAGEGIDFWRHMNSADVVAGVTNSGVTEWGEGLPVANVGGGFVVGFTATGTLTASTAGTAAGVSRAGHYLTLRSSPVASGAAGNAHLKATQAFRVDTKMDDGAPNTGTIIALGSVGSSDANCATASTNLGVYNELDDGISCSLYIRLQ